MAIKSVSAEDLSATVMAKAAAKASPQGSPVEVADSAPTSADKVDGSGKGLRKQLEDLLAEKQRLEEFAQSEYELRVKAEATAATRAPVSPPAATTEQKDLAPDPDDAKYAGDPKAFLKDRDDWNRREALREFKKAQEDETRKAAQERAAAEFNTRREASLVAARDQFKDFDDILKSADVRVRMGEIPAPPTHIQEALHESEYMAHLLYHFATNPDEAKAIFDMPRSRAALALGRLETRFEKKQAAEAKAEAKAPKPVAPPTVSKAPAPIPALSGGQGVIATNSAEATSFHDYKRLRMEEMKRRGRR